MTDNWGDKFFEDLNEAEGAKRPSTTAGSTAETERKANALPAVGWSRLLCLPHREKLMMRKIETTDAQNTLARMKENIYLNVENPSKRVKAQYRIVQKAIIDLHGALDDLNDLKNET